MSQTLKIDDRPGARDVRINAVDPSGPLLGVDDAVKRYDESFAGAVAHAGGGDAKAKEILDWASRNLPVELRDQYNRRLTDPGRAELAMAELRQLRDQARPIAARDAARQSGGFTSAREMSEARTKMSSEEWNQRLILTPNETLNEISAGRLL